MKPDYPQSKKTRSVSRDARLLNIHLWNMADDEGRLRELPNAIIGFAFPTDEDAPELLNGWLEELEEARMIVRYEIEGEHYIYCHDFKDHQKINRPTPSHLPAIPSQTMSVTGGFTEDSLSTHGDITECSLREEERRGREWKGEKQQAAPLDGKAGELVFSEAERIVAACSGTDRNSLVSVLRYARQLTPAEVADVRDRCKGRSIRWAVKALAGKLGERVAA